MPTSAATGCLVLMAAVYLKAPTADDVWLARPRRLALEGRRTVQHSSLLLIARPVFEDPARLMGPSPTSAPSDQDSRPKMI
jgi:hypothetical protein